MPSKSWGTSQTITSHIVVDGSAEIPAGGKVYVANQAIHEYDSIPAYQWGQFLSGDMSFVKAQIEQQIPGTTVIWLSCAWDKAIHQQGFGFDYYQVYGFKIEALCQNSGPAHLTGLEIVAIILAIAFISVVVALIVIGSWLVWRVEAAAEQLGPVVTIAVGLAILGGIGVLLYFLMGGGVEYKGKRESVRLSGRKRD
jgi:hypothetical protein